jgi:CHRD domain
MSRRISPLRVPLALIAALLAMMLVAGPALASHKAFLFTRMTGAKEIPPADEDGNGAAGIKINLDTSTVCWALRVEDITLPATAAHIHEGTKDETGDIVVTLSPPDATGHSRGCTTADSALLADIAENPGAYYVNVHNSDFPGGAIRGQLHDLRIGH